MSEGINRKLRPVEPLLRAKSVAIVGASPKGRWASLIFQNLKRAGYPGRIFLVNPNYSDLWGERCYPKLSALPEPAECLLLLVPTKAVLPTLEEGARLGARSATIYSAGFGEGDDAEGKARAEALKELCERTGLVCCGPNCMGTNSVRERLLCFATHVPLLRPGPVGLVFQSGGSLGNWMKGASERGIGFSYAVSSGNEISLDLVDYLAFLVDDPETRVIGLMIEGVRRPAEFVEVAIAALEKNKPILVVKVGRSERGRIQALSHTGALAGSDEVFDAVCHRLGLVRCPSLEDLIESTLAFLPGRLPRGRRIALVVNSGGMKGLLLDDIDELGVPLAELSEATRAALRPLIPPELAVENPLECGVAGFGDERGFLEIVRLHAEDPGVDLLGIHGELPRGEKRDPAPWAELAARTDKPVLAFSRATYSLSEESRAFQEQASLPFLQAIKPTLRALKALGAYAARRAAGVPRLPEASGPAEDLEGERLERLLAAHGLPLPRLALAASASEAAEAARAIGFPVALKLSAPGLVHKTEVGGVLLGLRGVEEVEREGRRLLASAPAPARLLVQEMVSGVEAIVGARQDPQFGPVVVVGFGGVFVELLKDVALRLAPVGEEEALEMVQSLKAYRLLEGFRGQPRRDIPALCRAVAGLSRLFAAYRLHLEDLEINPLIVKEEGAGVAAVDVRVIARPRRPS